MSENNQNPYVYGGSIKALNHFDYLELKRILTYASLRDVKEIKHAENVMTFVPLSPWHTEDYVPFTPHRKNPSVV